MDAGSPIPNSRKGVIYRAWEAVFSQFMPDPRDVALCQGPYCTLEEAKARLEAERKRVEAAQKKRRKGKG